MAEKLLWSVQDAAEQLGLTPASVYHRVHEGTLPYVKIGSLVKFRPKDLERWAFSLTSKPARTCARSVGGHGRRRMPGRSRRDS